MPQIYTVGHSNGSFSDFADLISQFGIQVVVDVRSYPFTKYATHFNYDQIQTHLKSAGFKYVYLGKELGGMPKNQALLDAEGVVIYEKVARTEQFKQGLSRLLRGAETYTIALMCAEENPAGCHRRNLIAKKLEELDIWVMHIRSNGKVLTEADLKSADSSEKGAQQLRIFS